MQPAAASLYKKVDLDSLLNSTTTQRVIDFILQDNGKQVSEAHTYSSMESWVEAKQHQQQQEFLMHVHNLKAVVMDPMFESFKDALSSQLENKSTKQMLSSCMHFMEFTDIMVDIMDNEQLYQEVLQAVTPFTDKYGTAQFWACAEHVYCICNSMRDGEQLPNISISAQYVMQELKANPQRGGEGGAMIMALAKFAELNSVPLMARHMKLLKLRQQATDAFKERV